MRFAARLTETFREDTFAPDTPVPDNALTSVRELAGELEEAKRNVADLERRYSQAVERLDGQLSQQTPGGEMMPQAGICSVDIVQPTGGLEGAGDSPFHMDLAQSFLQKLALMGLK